MINLNIFISEMALLHYEKYRGNYFANSRLFSAERVPEEFVYKRILAYLLIHKLYWNLYSSTLLCLLDMQGDIKTDNMW